MANTNVQATTEKYIRNLTSAVPAIKASIMAVTESPTQKAAAKAEEYVRGVQRAKESGKWQEGLRAVSLEDWKRATADKGAARIATGAMEAKGKMQAFFSQLLPHTAALSQQIAQMPKGSEADSVARMMANFDGMRRFRFVKGRV